MQKRVSAEATVAGVNGDLFSWTDGHPTGALIRGGILDSGPVDFRSSVGVDTDGVLHVERVRLAGTWQGSGQRRILGINEVPRANRTTLYTRAWGARTPAENGGAQAIIQPFPATKPNTPLTGVVTQYVTGGNQPIPPDGAVLVARGAQAGFLSAEAPIGANLTVLLTLTPPWANVLEAVGGGPIVVREGKPVYRSLEGFTTDQLAYRHPRTGVGQTADGRILLVAVDGRQPGYSTGLTNFELALTMMRLGCVTASALDAGGSTTMAFDGKLLNRPSDPGGERAGRRGTHALLLRRLRAGPTCPRPVAERRRCRRRADLRLQARAPRDRDGDADRPRGDRHPAGLGLARARHLQVQLDGEGQPEGAWTFRAVADDDLGRHSIADRQFGLNNTLGFVTASSEPPSCHGEVQARPACAGCAAHRDARRRHREDPRHPKLLRRRRDDLVAWPTRPLRLQRHRHERGRSGGAHRSFPAPPASLRRVPVAGVTSSLTSLIGNHGLYAVFFLMAIDAVFPAASELVMVYAGALAAGAFSGQHVDLFGARISSHAWAYVAMALAGTLGYFVGALVGWAIGRYGGRPLLERHGRWFHLDERQARACRALVRPLGRPRGPDRPGHARVRSFISIPAGIFRMPFLRYTRVDADRVGGLGLCACRSRVWARQQLRALSPRLPLRRTTPWPRRSWRWRRI